MTDTPILKPSPHPPWVRKFLGAVEPHQKCVSNSPFFVEMAEGNLSMRRFRAGLLYFYPLIEAFPKYMGLTLAKVEQEDSRRNNAAREWLLQNINIERKHMLWYRQWAIDFGVSRKDLKKVVPPPEIDAVNNYLWRVVHGGSLAESLAAVNFGIEGPSGVWSKRAQKRIEIYKKRKGVKFRNGTLFWIKAHADYDDKHPEEALELIKMFARSREEQDRVTLAAQRSMAYYAMAADAIYSLH